MTEIAVFIPSGEPELSWSSFYWTCCPDGQRG